MTATIPGAFDQATAAIPPLLSTYRTMVLSRALDEHCEDLLRMGVPVPHFHSGIGQEAVTVGAAVPLRPNDAMVYTHRGYGQLLAKGVPLEIVLCDLFMKEGGSNNGFGGIMHLTAPELGIVGREGVFGTRFPLSVGLALAARRQGSDRVVLCYYGEAAGARGPLYEALNMAVLWQLPVVLVAENNGWSFSSRTEWLYPEGRMSRVWRGFDIPVTEIDGNDTGAVTTAVAGAVEHARTGGGPAIIEAMTYRLSPHIWYDDEPYRSPDEVQKRRTGDPLRRTRAALLGAGIPEQQLLEVEDQARSQLANALRDVQQAAPARWPDGTRPTLHRSGRSERVTAPAPAPTTRAGSTKAMIERRTTRQALTRVLSEELRRHDTVLMGETVRGIGAAGVTAGLFDEHGPEKVIETPVSESGIVGAALGMAISGLRPVVEIYSADFILAIANEVMNDIPKWRQQQQHPAALPITIRACMGENGGLGPEHSQSMEPFLHHAPGLTVVVPGTPADAAGLLRAAVRGTEPVVFLEHRQLYDIEGDVPTDPDHMVPLGVAEVVRSGSDLTIVAWGWMRHEVLNAAARLAELGVEAEVIDPRTITPMDWDTVLGSADRTGRLLVVEEAPVTGGVAAEIITRACEGNPRAPRCARLTMPDAIHPYSADMEAAILPRAADVVQSALALCNLTERG